MKALTPLSPQALHEFWPWMRSGLDDVCSQFSPDWIPEDVYAAIRDGSCSPFAIGNRQGFLVCRIDVKPSGPVVFVWVAHAPGCLDSLMDAVYADLRELAAQHKCTRVLLQGRKGWGRKGWKLTSCNYELEK